MPDLKVSAETQVTTVAATTEWHVSEAGTDKALDVSQLSGYIVKRTAAATMAAGEYVSWLVLAANSSDITGTGFVTVMDMTGVGVGRYHFKCQLIYQTTATTTGINVTATHTGTTTQWYMEGRFNTTGGAAANKTATNTAATGATGLYEAEASIVKGSAIGTLGNFVVTVVTANSDLMVTI